MHAVFFGLKRAHQGTLRITREPLREIGLTPARFDLLYAVKKWRHGVLQSVLRKVLGVCRATVSKMLLSLEKRGLVKRSVYPHDRRHRLVELTPPGRESICGAQRDFMDDGWAELAFASAIGSTGLYRWYSEESCLEAKAWLLARLDALRKGFRDFASLEYPWAPYSEFDRLEDEDFDEEAFRDPFEEIAAREKREGIGRPPPGARPWHWNRDGTRAARDEDACIWPYGSTCGERRGETCGESAPPLLARNGNGATLDETDRPSDGPFPWESEGVLMWDDSVGVARARRRRRRPRRRRAGAETRARPG
jgi:DNA-binding MarR family transcriptional regulator